MARIIDPREDRIRAILQQIIATFPEDEADALVSVQPPLAVVMPESSSLLAAFDADILATLETILTNSPKAPTNMIYIKLKKGDFVVVCPLASGVYWVRLQYRRARLSWFIDTSGFEERLLAALDGV